jgi:hypothetical protein
MQSSASGVFLRNIGMIFCYPSSDDVTVVPVSGAWQLIYHHYEQFDFVTGS